MQQIDKFRADLAAAREADNEITRLRQRLDAALEARESKLSEMASGAEPEAGATTAVLSADVNTEVLHQKLERAKIAATEAWVRIADDRPKVLCEIRPQVEAIRDKAWEAAVKLSEAGVAETYKGSAAVGISNFASLTEGGRCYARLNNALSEAGRQPSGEVAKLKAQRKVEEIKLWADYFEAHLSECLAAVEEAEKVTPRVLKAADEICDELNR